MLFHITKIKSFSISIIDMMAMGKLELQCVQRHIQKWNIICPMWWTYSSITKWHWSTNPYSEWANKGLGHGNVKSLSGRIMYFDVSNGRGLKFHPPLQTTQKIPTNPWPAFEPFDIFKSLPEKLNSIKKK
jgi:hypothetical protein